MTVCVKIKGVHMYCELVKRKEIIGKTIASPLGRLQFIFNSILERVVYVFALSWGAVFVP